MTGMVVLCAAALAGPFSQAAPSAPGPGFWAPAVPPSAQYTMDLRLLKEGIQGSLELRETIRLTNNTARPIARLAIAFPAARCEKLDLRVGGEAAVLIPPAAGRSSGMPTLCALPVPLEPGGAVQLDAAFTQRLPVGWGLEPLLLRDWYPRLWWGFPAHDDYDVSIEVPPKWTVGTSGRRDAKTGRYVIQGAKDFGVFLGRSYGVMEADAGGVHIRALHTRAGEDCARLLLDTAVDVVTFYRERFGFYPYPNLTIVPGAARPMGGYPVAAAMVAVHGQLHMDQKSERHWRWITAHEIGHQYWGEYVLEKDTPGWLWIGMGIYADREYVRAKGLGLKEHHALMARYTASVEQGLDTTLALSPAQYRAVDFDFNNVCIHGKGFGIISALAWMLGLDSFDRAHTRCLREFAGRRLGAADFQRICEEESGQNLGWFFEPWLRSNRCLAYEAGEAKCAKRDGQYVSKVAVKRTGTLSMPVPVAAYFNDGTVQERRTDRLLDLNELTFVSAAPLERVQVDPRDELAMATPPRPAMDLGVGRAIQGLPWTGSGSEALKLFPQAQEEKLEDAGSWAKLGMTLYDGEHYAQALEAFERAVEYAHEAGTAGFVALVWQGQVLDLLGRREEAIQRYETALENDTGGTVRHDQYGLRLNRAWVLKKLRTPFRRN